MAGLIYQIAFIHIVCSVLGFLIFHITTRGCYCCPIETSWGQNVCWKVHLMKCRSAITLEYKFVRIEIDLLLTYII